MADEAPKPLSTAEILKLDSREFIIMVGKDGSGKSCAVVSMAHFVQTVLNPKAKFFIIDTENKFPTALKSFGADAPTNIVYYKVDTMNEANYAMAAIMAQRKPDDWFACESMSRLWDKAQDMAYMAVSGYSKSAYLEIRRTKIKAAPVTPKPDEFWSIAKGAHDAEFLELLNQARSLNVILTATIGKADNPRYKPNATRQAVKTEFGIDLNIDGAPRLPYSAETLVFMGMEGDMGTCRVVRDNLSGRRIDFQIPGHTLWGTMFYSNLRV